MLPPSFCASLQTEDKFVECREKDTPIAVVVVEPIQAEGGEADNWFKPISYCSL